MTTVSKLNPRTQHYEFCGPFGAAFVTLAVPITTYALYFGCSETSGGCPPPLPDIPVYFINAVTNQDWWKSLWDTEAFLAYLAWYSFTVVAWYVLPGDWIEGVTMRDAFSTFLLTLGLAAGAIIRFGPTALTFVYEHWVGLITSTFIMATVQAIYVYVASFEEGKLLALGGNSGNLIYDFYIGRELNPSIGSFDIKSFNELRPGLILWALVDIAMACEQATRLGGRITDSMVLVLIFQLWYIGDGLYNEVFTSSLSASPIADNPVKPAIFTTMDITTDGFGFMLSIGDLTWVPMVYSLQARYLVFNQVELGSYLAVAVFLLHGIGYYIFRGANGEKNDFRNGRNPKNLQFFVTESGSKLLTSGWWGMSRHPNYFGDILMASAYSMATGFNTPITYFYPAYFAVLLIHRQIRDDENCAKKYGKDWEKYKRLVPYRIIPYVY